MAIYTPRGLKVRLSVAESFALMSRLFPSITPFSILKTTEGLEAIPSLLSYIGALLGIFLYSHPAQITLLTVSGFIIGYIITRFGLFFIPGLVRLGVLYSYIEGWGLLFVSIGVVAYIMNGWTVLLAFVIGEIMVGIVNFILGFLDAYWFKHKIGVPLTISEVNFFNAYRIHASDIGMTTSIVLSDEELSEDSWKEAYNWLDYNWPSVVSRFS